MCRRGAARPARAFTTKSGVVHSSDVARSGPFVSQHFEGLPAGAVVEFLGRQGAGDWKRGASGWLNLRLCPDAVCGGTDTQQASKANAGNHYTFGVHEKSGGFQCFRCGAKGSWYTFKQRLTGSSSPPIVAVADTAHPRQLPSSPAAVGVAVDLGGRGPEGESRKDLEEQRGQLFLQYAEALPGCEPAIDFLCVQRCIREEVLKAFKVGVAIYNFKGRQLTSVTFPWFTKEQELPVRVKVRALEDKKHMRLDPAGGPWGFFGWPTVAPDSTVVVLTEGKLLCSARALSTRLHSDRLQSIRSSDLQRVAAWRVSLRSVCSAVTY